MPCWRNNHPRRWLDTRRSAGPDVVWNFRARISRAGGRGPSGRVHRARAHAPHREFYTGLQGHEEPDKCTRGRRDVKVTRPLFLAVRNPESLGPPTPPPRSTGLAGWLAGLTSQHVGRRRIRHAWHAVPRAGNIPGAHLGSPSGALVYPLDIASCQATGERRTTLLPVRPVEN